MTMFAGIDIGTTFTKGIILDLDGKIAGRAIERTGADHKYLAEHILDSCLEKAGKDKKDINGIALTGFGRSGIDTIHSIPVVSYPDVLCICKGVYWYHAGSKNNETWNNIDEKKAHKQEKQESFLILDIGGEKWKFIYSENGSPKDFISNDICAVGTGKFLDYVAKSLKIGIDDITAKAMKSKKICEIKQTCGIFVEAEIISKLSQGEKVEDLFAGMFEHMFNCIQSKVPGFRQKSGILYMTGGVSQNVFLQKLFAKEYKRVIFPRDAQFMGALGASLFLFCNQKNKGEITNERKK